MMDIFLWTKLMVDYNKTHSWIMVSAYKRRQLKFHMKIIHQRSLKDCTSRD
ncbi:hypothetical protein HanIR_Chr11g0529191 [Helianthus annuus]|nr:hypothetical protein HanIR_Chr11g0529191 [Helianthus annuus]